MNQPRAQVVSIHRSSQASSDAAAMQQLAEGDLTALGNLYDQYAEDVRRFAVRATGKVDVADDLTQDVFLALPDAAPRFDTTRSVRSFIIGIAAKHVLRRRRSVAVAFRIIGQLADWVTAKDTRTPDETAAASEALRRYEQALAQLSDAKRVVVLMADVEELTGPEIAAALDIPLGTVWTRLHHARSELRAAVFPEHRSEKV